MKKVLIAGMVFVGLLSMNVQLVHADGHYKGSKCTKSKSCDKNEKKCKMSELKKAVKMVMKNQEALGVTDEQMMKIKKIKRQALKDMILLKANAEVTKIDIKAAMWTDQINASEVNKLIDSKYATKAKIAKTYVKALADMQAELDAEQRAAVHKMCVAKKLGGSDCYKCASKKGKICPITGKSLEDKGSHKGSMK